MVTKLQKRQKVILWGILLVISIFFFINYGSLLSISFYGSEIRYVDSSICKSNQLIVSEPKNYMDYLKEYCIISETINSSLFNESMIIKAYEKFGFNQSVLHEGDNIFKSLLPGFLCITKEFNENEGIREKGLYVFSPINDDTELNVNSVFSNFGDVDFCPYAISDALDSNLIEQTNFIVHTKGYKVKYPDFSQMINRTNSYAFCSGNTIVFVTNISYERYLSKYTQCLNRDQPNLINESKIIEKTLCQASGGVFNLNSCICPSNSIGYKNNFGCDYLNQIPTYPPKETIKIDDSKNNFFKENGLLIFLGLIFISMIIFLFYILSGGIKKRR
ncbi:MAG: hypothetical protein AABY22_23275 [Nanoarchaeota archaeon]